jgi:hypothetical protein
MPAFRARSTGLLKAVGSISVVEMPFTLAAIATSIAFTMSEVAETVDPVHWGLGMWRIAAASCSPYWVGPKNVFVVTWLTNVNL